MFRTFTRGILHHTIYLLHSLKITDVHGFLHLSTPKPPDHDKEGDAETSISATGSAMPFYLMGQNSARECFRPPEWPKAWRLQRQLKVWQWVLLYWSWVSRVWAFRWQHHREGSSQQLNILEVVAFVLLLSGQQSFLLEKSCHLQKVRQNQISLSLTHHHGRHGPMLWHWSRSWKLINYNMMGICQKNLFQLKSVNTNLQRSIDDYNCTLGGAKKTCYLYPLNMTIQLLTCSGPSKKLRSCCVMCFPKRWYRLFLLGRDLISEEIWGSIHILH